MAVTPYNQPSAAPNSKTTAAALGGLSGGAAATLFLIAVKVVSPETYDTITEVPEATLAIGSFFTALMSFVAAYTRRERTA